jgi:hypothetical protein
MLTDRSDLKILLWWLSKQEVSSQVPAEQSNQFAVVSSTTVLTNATVGGCSHCAKNVLDLVWLLLKTLICGCVCFSVGIQYCRTTGELTSRTSFKWTRAYPISWNWAYPPGSTAGIDTSCSSCSCPVSSCLCGCKARCFWLVGHLSSLCRGVLVSDPLGHG